MKHYPCCAEYLRNTIPVLDKPAGDNTKRDIYSSMPQDYRIDEQQQVLWTRCWGVLSDQDIIAHQAKLRADPKFSPTIKQFVDACDVTKVAVTVEAVNQLGASTLFAPAAKRAYFVGKDALYGLVRMYEMQQAARGTDSIRVFRDRAVALAWLGITEPKPGMPKDGSQGS